MLGASFALLCAILWSVAVILFKKSGDNVHPVLLNLVKNTAGLVLMIPTVLLVEGTGALDLAGRDLIILLVSGLLGIGLADAMVLKALKEIGAARVAIVECAYSPFIITFSLLFLGERLNEPKIAGCLLVISAILCVSLPQRAAANAEARPKNLVSGVLWGVLGLFSMAGGIVMVKPVFATVPLFWVITIRLAAGVAASVVIFAVLPNKHELIATLRRVERPGMMAIACVISTYISMMLWVAGFKYNDAAIAAVLNQTSTIFTVILAAVFLKEKMTPRKVLGTALAASGVLMITLN